jgi:ATP diphosphatase
MTESRYELLDLLRVMERLRDPETGCPWDLEQTFKSIVPSTIEECYELADAIEAGDYEQIAEELGDVLFQVVFYAQMASEEGHFSFPDIVNHLVEKLLRRHPHVFGGGEIETLVDETSGIEEVGHTWEVIKRQERHAKSMNGLLDDVPIALPALSRAQKLQRRAAQVGFDWVDIRGVLAKFHEESAELQQALDSGSDAEIQNELGDILFTAVNLARRLQKDAESTLRAANNKFESRFRLMEQLAAERGQMLEQIDAEALDALWEAAKASESAVG